MSEESTREERDFLTWALPRLRTAFSASNYILLIEQEPVASALSDRGLLAFDGEVQRFVLTDAGIQEAKQLIRSGPLGSIKLR